MTKTIINQNRLKQLLKYDSKTGVFTRKLTTSTGKYKVGDKAGGYNSQGYIKIHLEKNIFRGHHLAWLYVYGEWPKEQIDHINGIRDDNRIVNLREINNSGNCQNIRKPQKNNKTGFLGVSYMKNRNKFRASITVNWKYIHLGLFNKAEEAYQAYLEAKRKYHYFGTL